MRWLQRQLAAAGVQQVQRKLTSLGDVADEGWDVVINCCGVGAERLVPDPHCYPIRGQIMRVKAPWVTQCVFAHFPDETAYIIPNRWVERAAGLSWPSPGNMQLSSGHGCRCGRSILCWFVSGSS